MVTIEKDRLGAGTTVRIRDVDLFVDVIGQTSTRPDARRAGSGPLVDEAVRAPGRSVHGGLLRPPLQRTLGG